MRLLQAVVSARGATSTVTGNAEFTAQILQGAGTTLSRLTNLTVSYRLANADIHGNIPRVREGFQMGMVLILIK
jgi:hypothetical protein